MKHTPGPWIIQNQSDNGNMYHIESEGWGIIHRIEDTSNEPFYNARLIAAAPEMLALLERMVDDPELTPEEGLKLAKDVIRKATGE